MGNLVNEMMILCNKMYTDYTSNVFIGIVDDLKTFFGFVKNLLLMLSVTFTYEQFENDKDNYKQKIRNSIIDLKQNKATKEKYDSLVETVREMSNGIRKLLLIIPMADVKTYFSNYMTELQLIDFITFTIDEVSFSDENYIPINVPNEKSLTDFCKDLNQNMELIASLNKEEYKEEYNENKSCSSFDNTNRNNLEGDEEEEELEKMNQLQQMMLMLQQQMLHLSSKKKSKMETNEHKLKKIVNSENPDFAKFFELLSIPNIKFDKHEIFKFINLHFYETDQNKSSQRIKNYVNPLRSDIMEMLNKIANNDELCCNIISSIAKYWKLIINSAIKSEIDKSSSLINSQIKLIGSNDSLNGSSNLN